MTDKNPYETYEDTIDIPVFAQGNNEEDVNMEVFSVPEETFDDEPAYSFDEESDSNDNRPSNKIPKKLNVKVLLAILCGILLVGTVLGLVYGSSEHRKAQQLQSKYDEYVSTAEKTIADLKATVAAKEKEISDLKSGGSVVKPEDGKTVTYVIDVDAVNIRRAASTDSEKIGTLKKDNLVQVLETVEKGGMVWGKISYDNKEAYFCIKNGNDVYAKAK